MNGQEKKKKHRFSLSLMLSGTVFLVLLLTMSIVALGELIVLNVNIMPDTPGLYTFVIFSAIASVIIGTTLTLIFGKFPLVGIDKIINSMDRLAGGDYTARIRTDALFTKIPAVSEFIRSFNKMAKELENTEMLRSDFVNNFSHEFKTPIVSIAGFAKLLQRDDLTDEQRREYLAIIEDESLRLSALSTNMLNFSKIEKQTILTDVTDFNLSEQLRTCVLLLQNEWEKKKIAFDMDFDEYRLDGNEELLKQVWINLLDNAIKYSPSEATVGVTIKKGSGTVSVSISNIGKEIPPEEREKIFQRFYQSDPSHTKRGNGIGLAIVKSVTTLHGGTVEVSSGGGKNIFTVNLPEKQS